ncbi:MAG: hypothetical protein VKP57_08060 [Candidatus Sericytochromatia bacterium]|nr:hypothetical protein [Candidatus Sericytochromatia bacterium]
MNLAAAPESWMVPFVALRVGGAQGRGYPVFVPWFFAMMMPVGSLISIEGFWFQSSVSGIVAEHCRLAHFRDDGSSALLRLLPEAPGACTRCKVRLTGMVAWGFDESYRFECGACGIRRRGREYRHGRTRRPPLPTDVPKSLDCPLCHRTVSRREILGHVVGGGRAQSR